MSATRLVGPPAAARDSPLSLVTCAGFDKAVEECKHRMSRYGVTPNMLVLPPQMLLYMALAPEQKLTYATQISNPLICSL